LWDKKDFYIMKMLFLVLVLLLNDKEGAHATQGKQTYRVDMPSFLIVVVDCNRCNGRGGVVAWKKLKSNERNIVIDSFEQLVHYSKTD